MVVVAIISILAVIALPQYQKFTTKAKVSAALAELAGNKGLVTASVVEGDLNGIVPRMKQLLPASSARCSEFTIGINSLPGDEVSFSLGCVLADPIADSAEIRIAQHPTMGWECYAFYIPTDVLPNGCRKVL